MRDHDPVSPESGPAWEQIQLFPAVARVYAEAGQATNETLYRRVADELGLRDADIDQARQPIGRDGKRHNLYHRRIRWIQQTMKREGLIERVPGRRGCWQPTGRGRHQLNRWGRRSVSLIGFSTRLGVAILGDCRSVLGHLDEPVTLCVTSPPYPMAKPRAYGNPSAQEYTDFICQVLEPIVRNLKPGGSIVLNLSNDIFEPGTPARSLYRERLLIALADRFGLSKMDEVIWWNPTKPPGPTQWACKTRQQLCHGWEPLFWLTNDPARCDADNRRVLQPHSDRQRSLIRDGGEHRQREFAEGRHCLRDGDFGNDTPGRIPRNVLSVGHVCQGAQKVNRYADAHGLPRHGAMFPESLVEFFVRFLSSYEDLVVDPMMGGGTVPAVAERLGRRWLATELVGEYMQAAGAARFHPDETWLNPQLWAANGRGEIQPRAIPAAA